MVVTGSAFENALGVFAQTQLQDTENREVKKCLSDFVKGAERSNKTTQLSGLVFNEEAAQNLATQKSKIFSDQVIFDNGNYNITTKGVSQNKMDVRFSFSEEDYRISAKNTLNYQIHLVRDLSLLYPFANLMSPAFQYGYMRLVRFSYYNQASNLYEESKRNLNDFSDLLKRGSVIMALTGQGHSDISAGCLIINKRSGEKKGIIRVIPVSRIINLIMDLPVLSSDIVTIKPADFDKSLQGNRNLEKLINDFEVFKSGFLVQIQNIKLDISLQASKLGALKAPREN